MQGPVLSVSPETPLVDVHRLFVDQGIHGAPVVTDDGRLLGVVTTSDLIAAVLEEHESAAFGSEYLRELVEFSGPDWSRGGPEDFQDRLGSLRAEDVMTQGAVKVQAATPVAEVAALMRQQRIHRVWVIERGLLAGVVSTFDLLPLVEKTP
jgi:CBS domain-containing protein